MTLKWFSELWRYRELAFFLAWRDVKVRYKQAALGAAWAILQPLLTMLVFTLFFGQIAGFHGDGASYALFSFSGLVLWTYFSGAISNGGQSLLANSNLITKVYFPRAVLPLSAAMSGTIDLAVGLVCLACLVIYNGVQPTWFLLLAPIFLALLIVLAVGLGMCLAALTVRYRDVKYVIPFLIQLGLFVTPIIYPTSLVNERLRPLLALNPLAGIVEGFRACLFPGKPFDPMLTLLSVTVTLLVLVFGYSYFRATERSFADII